jgi:hypothetical protein
MKGAGQDTYAAIVNDEIPSAYLVAIRGPQRRWMLWGAIARANLSDDPLKHRQHRFMILSLLGAAMVCAFVDLIILRFID